MNQLYAGGRTHLEMKTFGLKSKLTWWETAIEALFVCIYTENVK